MTSTNDDDSFDLSDDEIINDNYRLDNANVEALDLSGFGANESREGVNQNDVAMAVPPPPVKPSFPDPKKLFNGTEEMNRVRFDSCCMKLCFVQRLTAAARFCNDCSISSLKK